MLKGEASGARPFDHRCVSGWDTPDASGAGPAPGREIGEEPGRFRCWTNAPGTSIRPRGGGVTPNGAWRPRRKTFISRHCRAFRHSATPPKCRRFAPFAGSSLTGRRPSRRRAEEGLPPGGRSSLRRDPPPTRAARPVEAPIPPSKLKHPIETGKIPKEILWLRLGTHNSNAFTQRNTRPFLAETQVRIEDLSNFLVD